MVVYIGIMLPHHNFLGLWHWCHSVHKLLFATCLISRDSPSAESAGLLIWVEYRPHFILLLLSVILQHPVVHSCILALDSKCGLGHNSRKNEVIVAMWAIFIGILELLNVFTEALATLFAGENHF